MYYKQNLLKFESSFFIKNYIGNIIIHIKLHASVLQLKNIIHKETDIKVDDMIIYIKIDNNIIILENFFNLHSHFINNNTIYLLYVNKDINPFESDETYICNNIMRTQIKNLFHNILGRNIFLTSNEISNYEIIVPRYIDIHKNKKTINIPFIGFSCKYYNYIYHIKSYMWDVYRNIGLWQITIYKLEDLPLEIFITNFKNIVWFRYVLFYFEHLEKITNKKIAKNRFTKLFDNFANVSNMMDDEFDRILENTLNIPEKIIINL